MAVKKSVANAKPTKKAAAKKSPATRAKAKAAPKTTSARKAPARKAPAKKPRVTAISEVQTKAQIITAIAAETQMTKKDVAAVFSAMAKLVAGHMTKRGSGEFTIPDVGVKLKRVKKPATKARTMISPFTKQEISVPAKPASDKIRLTGLKALKDTVG